MQKKTSSHTAFFNPHVLRMRCGVTKGVNKVLGSLHRFVRWFALPIHSGTGIVDALGLIHVEVMPDDELS